MKKTHRSYIAGYGLSLLLTLIAYFIVQAHVNSLHESIPHRVLVPAILILAVVQLVVQLIFFLHLGFEPGPRWKMGIFFATIALVLIVLVGSIWIMDHLNYNMTPSQIELYIQQQQGGF